MKFFKPVMILLMLSISSTSAIAVDANKANDVAIKNKISTILGLNVSQITASPMAGISEVMTDQGMFYVSSDGNFILQGKLYGLALKWLITPKKA